MKILVRSFLLITLLFTLELSAQDTTVVRTLELDSPTRSGTFTFPDDDSKSYRQILMQYKMRCLNGDVNPGDNSTGCHEWDYSCNTFLTDPTTEDSLRSTHPTHVISNFNGESFEYTTEPVYSYFEYLQKEVSYDAVLTEEVYESGTGTANLSHPFSASSLVGKSQYLWTAEELNEAGLEAGPITSLRMDLSNSGAVLEFLRIKIKETSSTFLDENNVSLTGFTEVYFLDTPPLADENAFLFHTPFEWNGTSNLVLEFSFNRDGFSGTDSEALGGTIQEKVGITSSQEDQFFEFKGSDFLELETSALSSISEEITISAWVKGNENVLPVNTSLLEAIGPDGLRQVNVHLPWSNSRVYWDCGNEGGGYDRIDKLATSSNFANKWNHWTFVKNATEGTMKMYLNGNLWHSGTAKYNTMEIEKFVLGGSGNFGNPYYGGINELRIWNKEIEGTTIKSWMRRDLDESHPNYENLVAYYPFDGENTALNDATGNAAPAEIKGAPLLKRIKGQDLFRNFDSLSERPNVRFVRGTYESTINEITVTVPEINGQTSITEYSVDGTDLVEGNTLYVWAADSTYFYNEAGEVVDAWNVEAESSVNIGSLEYYRKFPSKYELLSFVTPYGFFLDLGPEGQTWTFDVTDFAPVLKGERILSMERGGQYNEEYEITFEFIEGTPAREVLSIQNIWPFASGGFSAIVEDGIFEPKMVTLSEEGSSFKIRNSVTGHQQNGEFLPRTHYLNLDGGEREFSFDVWKRCDLNPVYPQGGTWIFDRAGWCPGMPSDLQELDLSPYVIPGQTVEIDYGVQAVSDLSATNYLVSNQLVTYGPVNFAVDAEIMEIKNPNNSIKYAKENPSCNNPVVVIRNLGSEPLTSCRIVYGAKESAQQGHNWTGNLAFGESEEVTMASLLTPIWQGNSTEIFEVTLKDVNDTVDENLENNQMEVPFTPTDKLEGVITINYRTNNRASENKLVVTNSIGSLVLQRENFENNTVYSNDILLSPGCYTMEFTDTGGDGLDFWYWAAVGEDVGTGFIRVQQDGSTIKQFEPDFGGVIRYDFFVDGDQVITGLEEGFINIGLYPNPAYNELVLELDGLQDEEVQLEILDLTGRILHQERLHLLDNKSAQRISVRDFPNGLYIAQIRFKDQVIRKNFVKEGR